MEKISELQKIRGLIRKYISQLIRSGQDLDNEKILSKAHNEVCLTHRGIPVPPIRLRDMVRRGATLPEDFILEGAQAYDKIRKGLVEAGAEFNADSRIMEFGVGCGRIARHFFYDGVNRFIGTDVDYELIDWCNENLASLDSINFLRNGYVPPLPLESESISLCYSISVFTHMDIENQKVWAGELARVIKPDGLLYISFHERSEKEIPAGVKVRKRVDPEHQRSWFGKEGAPDVYFGTHNTKEYFLNLFSQNFEPINYYNNHIRNIQSAFVLRRK